MSQRARPDSPVTTANTLAGRVARVWVHLYTRAVSRDVRDRRRAEIDSDVWEHISDARSRRRTELGGQFEVLRRVVAGIPADVAWVADMRVTHKESKSMKQRRLQVIVIACASVIIANFIVSNLIVDDFSTLPSFWWVLAVPIGLFLVGIVGIAAGVLLVKERRDSPETLPRNS